MVTNSRRHLSCYCDECLKCTAAGFDACENKPIVGEWTVFDSFVKDTAGIAAAKKRASAKEEEAAKQYVALAGTAVANDVVVVDGHKGVDFSLGVVDETMRKASTVDAVGDDPPPIIKVGRRKEPAEKDSWKGPDGAVFRDAQVVLGCLWQVRMIKMFFVCAYRYVCSTVYEIQ